MLSCIEIKSLTMSYYSISTLAESNSILKEKVRLKNDVQKLR